MDSQIPNPSQPIESQSSSLADLRFDEELSIDDFGLDSIPNFNLEYNAGGGIDNSSPGGFDSEQLVAEDSNMDGKQKAAHGGIGNTGVTPNGHNDTGSIQRGATHSAINNMGPLPLHLHGGNADLTSPAMYSDGGMGNGNPTAPARAPAPATASFGVPDDQNGNDDPSQLGRHPTGLPPPAPYSAEASATKNTWQAAYLGGGIRNANSRETTLHPPVFGSTGSSSTAAAAMQAQPPEDSVLCPSQIDREVHKKIAELSAASSDTWDFSDRKVIEVMREWRERAERYVGLSQYIDDREPPLNEDVARGFYKAYVRRPLPKEIPPAVSAWKEKQNSFTAIRGRPENPQRYVGARKTYEYVLQDGNKKTKTDWLMHEYYLLDPHPDGSSHLVIDEDMVLRVVFRSDEGRARKQPRCSNTAESDHARPAKRQKSAVWDNATEIVYNKHNKRVYAVCNSCDMIIHADSEKHGTGSIKRHQSTCSRSAGASTSSQPEASGLSATA